MTRTLKDVVDEKLVPYIICMYANNYEGMNEQGAWQLICRETEDLRKDIAKEIKAHILQMDCLKEKELTEDSYEEAMDSGNSGDIWSHGIDTGYNECSRKVKESLE